MLQNSKKDYLKESSFDKNVNQKNCYCENISQCLKCKELQNAKEILCPQRRNENR